MAGSILAAILTDSERTPPQLLYTEPHWYACYTRSRHEKHVEAALRDRRPREERDLGAFSDLSEFPEREASEFPEPTNARRRSVVKAAVANASVAIVAG